MGRAPCCDKANVKKGPWSPEEDEKLKDFIHKHGTANNWIALPQKAGLRRCGKSCRLRWLNYLRPNIKHGHFSDEEDTIISTLYANIGSRWSIIASQLPGRTDNDIKNYWNTKLKKKIYGGMSQSLSSLYNHQPPNLHSNNLLLYSNAHNNIPAAAASSSSHGGGGGGGYYYPMKDNMLVFGGGMNEAAPSCSSSDGSCGKELHEAGFFQGFAVQEPILDHHHHRLRDGVLDNTQLHYDLEEVKHLLTAAGGGGGGGGLLFGDEEKGGEMGGMYYF